MKLDMIVSEFLTRIKKIYQRFISNWKGRVSYISHYTAVRTQIKNRDCLVKALNDLGFEGKVELHDGEGANLYGYMGDKRTQTANVILRRKHVGGSSNDIGWKLREDGTYEAIISEYDSGKYNKAWCEKLMQRYSLHTIKKQARAQGYTISEEVIDSKGEITITVETYWGKRNESIDKS